MNSEEKKRNRCSIKTFYAMNHEKGKVFTFDKFKKCRFSRSQIFRIMAHYDTHGFEDRKVGSGRLLKLTWAWAWEVSFKYVNMNM